MRWEPLHERWRPAGDPSTILGAPRTERREGRLSTLERAIALAARKHEGQLDKAGAPYILHPIRVMLRVASLEEKMAAVLHDVVEDTDTTFEDLAREGFPPAGGPA